MHGVLIALGGIVLFGVITFLLALIWELWDPSPPPTRPRPGRSAMEQQLIMRQRKQNTMRKMRTVAREHNTSNSPAPDSEE
jgi:hypothetical protein